MNNKLFEEIKIGNYTVKNRVVLPPMSLLGADEKGRATEKMALGYENYAKGGFGMIITEGLYIDEAYSQGAPKQPGLVNREQMDSWKPIIEKVHEHGTIMVAQLAHIGAFGRGNQYVKGTIAPSAIQINEQLPIPKEITKIEITEIVKSFAETAKRAEEIGFDGVEIHGAMGLVQQFLSTFTNHREDEYGGNLENRMRFLKEIISAIRTNTSETFLLGMRILPDEMMSREELQRFFEILGNEPIDYIHTSEKDATEKLHVDSNYTFSSFSKEYSGKIVIAAGGLGDSATAKKMIEYTDMVSIGKAALANPDWVTKVQADS